MNFPELSVHIENTPAELAVRIADDFVTFLQRMDYHKNQINIALSGGSTPNLLFKKLTNDHYKKVIDWKNIHIFQVDERWVPQDHKDNNFRTLKQLLLDNIDIPTENIHPMPVTQDEPDTVKNQYIETLRATMNEHIPKFDLIWLGMGDDGHTASIFPGYASKEPIETDELVSIPFVEKLKSKRMTLTAKVLLHAKLTWFFITGENKSGVLREVVHGEYNPELYPSQIISISKGKVEFYLDQGAFSELKKLNYKNSVNLKQ